MKNKTVEKKASHTRWVQVFHILNGSNGLEIEEHCQCCVQCHLCVTHSKIQFFFLLFYFFIYFSLSFCFFLDKLMCFTFLCLSVSSLLVQRQIRISFFILHINNHTSTLNTRVHIPMGLKQHLNTAVNSGIFQLIKSANLVCLFIFSSLFTSQR